MRNLGKRREWTVKDEDRVADLKDRLRVLAWAVRGLAADKPAVMPEVRVQYAMAAELEWVARKLQSLVR